MLKKAKHSNTKANAIPTIKQMQQNINYCPHLVSVIIPCYNSSETIKRAIDSVLTQTFDNFEIIIVEDGSNEQKKTETIINNYNDERINFIKHQQNKNGAAARNTGINVAKGEYIAFLDADDEWLPNHLKESLDFIQKTKCDLSYCQSIIKTTGFKDLILPEHGITRKQSVGDYLFTKNGFIPTPSIVFNRKKIKTTFSEKLIRHQDYDFLLNTEGAGHFIAMAPHVGVIVHWVNNNTERKGGTWNFALEWVNDYKGYLSQRAYRSFIYKNVVTILLKKRKVIPALRYFFGKFCFLYLPAKEWFFFFSYVFFGKMVYSKIKKTTESTNETSNDNK